MDNTVTHYIAMWDMHGLECIFNVTEFFEAHSAWEKKKMWDVLKGEKLQDIQPPRIPIQEMMLRARYNSHRFYEIYEFNSTVSEIDIRKAFKDNPQPLVEWIRENGYKVYGEPLTTDKRVIV